MPRPIPCGSFAAMSRPLVLIGYAVFAVTCLVALATPVAMGGRIEPFVWGLPFPVWWNALWVVCAFLALVAMHVLAGGEET